MPNFNLDNVAEFKKIDSENFLEVLSDFPQQCKVGWEFGQQIELPKLDAIQNIVVTGLGGSAIGGDFLRVYLAKFGKVAVSVNRDYTLPAFVNDKTLIFAVSYSGNTEETLSAYDDGKQKGAKIIVLTSGGELAKKATQDNFPIITVPAGFQPRAATGYLFLPLLGICERLGFLNTKVDIENLVKNMENIKNEVSIQNPEELNPAKALARQLFNRIPVIYGTCGVSEAIAMRFKGQINENSKAMAYFNVLPELNHNEVVGTEFPREFLDKVSLVFLRSEDDHPRVSMRFDITKDMLKGRVGEIIEVHAKGDNFLSRMFYLTYLGDVMSVYLSVLYGANPTPVDIITTLKNKLRG